MFRIELTNKNNVVVKKLECNNLSEIYTFMQINTPELFNYQDNINDYLIEILLNYYYDNKKNLTIEEQHERNRLTAYNDALYYALNDDDNRLVDMLTNKLNNELDYIVKDKKVCQYLLEQVNLYGIGVNFKKVSE